MTLNDWDRRLLERHLDFYRDLANGRRSPTTAAQEHFVQVCSGLAKARTQHEVAYQKFLAVNASDAHATNLVHSLTPAASRTANSRSGGELDVGLDRLESAIDTIEEVQFDNLFSKNASRLFGTVKNAYKANSASLGRRVSEAGLWIAALTADREWGEIVGRAAGDTFNNVSNIYTKAMDAGFAEGLKSGEAYVSPWLHRLIDGGHTVAGAWEKVQSALPHDTRIQELAGFSQAYLSDFSSRAGMPVATISEDTFRVLDSIVQSAGLPFDWAADALTANLEELVAAFIPGIAVLLNWNASEREAFRQMIGAAAVAGLVGANPIAVLVVVVGMAREFHLNNRKYEGVRDFAEALAKGGLVSGIVVTSSAAIGGPILVGMVTGIALVLLAKQAGARIDWVQLLEMMRTILSEKEVTRLVETPTPFAPQK